MEISKYDLKCFDKKKAGQLVQIMFGFFKLFGIIPTLTIVHNTGEFSVLPAMTSQTMLCLTNTLTWSHIVVWITQLLINIKDKYRNQTINQFGTRIAKHDLSDFSYSRR